MKKTLLAAALMAGFAGIAQAETSVTLYGVVDGGIGYHQTKFSENRSTTALQQGTASSFKNNRTGLIDGVQLGNRWGLRGTEDLGNGLRAVFVLESGFSLGTGHQAQGGRLFGRQATLGLAGDSWGQLDLGRQTNIASKYLGEASPFGYGFDQANLGAAMSAANTVRYDNMVMYQTPNFSGFQFGVGYSFRVNGNQAGSDTINGAKVKTDNPGVTAGLRYNNGPIGAGLTYDQFKDRQGVTSNGGTGSVTAKAWGAAFSYDFDVVKLHLGGGQTRDGMFAQTLPNTNSSALRVFNDFEGTKGSRINSYIAGLSAPVGEGKVMASWQMADLSKLPTAYRNSDLRKKKEQTYSLGYVHPLSKRTDVYAIGSYAKNAYFVDSQKTTLLGVGLTHRF